MEISVAAVLVAVTLNAVPEPPKDLPVRLSCADVQSAVKTHGEEAVAAEARKRGIPEAVINFIKRKCLEGK